MTRVPYLLTLRDSHHQTGHNDFEVREGPWPRFLRAGCLVWTLVRLSLSCISNQCALPTAWEEEVCQTASPAKVASVSCSYFVVHAYHPDDEFSWRCFHYLRRHIYLMPLSYDLEHTVECAYGESLVVVIKAETDSEEKRLKRIFMEPMELKRMTSWTEKRARMKALQQDALTPQRLLIMHLQLFAYHGTNS